MGSRASELLASGVRRYLPGASFECAPEGYACIRAVGPPLEDPPEGAEPRGGLVFLDLESLGFLGRPLFLVGALFAGAGPETPGGRAHLVQYLARDYSEEEAVLRAFARDARETETWVTFNGRTFDVPLLRLRASYHRLAPPRPHRHLDLLPVARRLWGRGLPNCRLQTLERHICGRGPRIDDIPGSEIPRAYHDFVRTGEPWEMLRILEHNAGDLLALHHLLRAARASGYHEADEPR